MKKNITLFLLAFIIMGLAFSGCQINKNVIKDQNHGKKLTVYTSFFTMYDFARKIGGDKINLINLVPAGTEPHEWEPSPKDIAGLENADLLIYNGAGMEGWIDRILASISNSKLTTVEAAKGLRLVGNTAADNLQYDPHVWLNPMLAQKQMEVIKDSFVTADPANKEYYEKNFQENTKKVNELNQKYKAVLSKSKKRDIIVAHRAFGYLVAAYGLNQVSIEGLSADSEPTPARMAEIAKFAKENNVKYIFFEELISPKVADAIAKEVGAKTEVLDPFEGPKEGKSVAEYDYFSVMTKNLEALKKALS